MIVICDKAQDIVIPAGLGDNAGVVYEKSGVESLNGQQGDLTLKTVNGNELLGEGNVAIDTGVESLNGQKGALTLKTVNGNELTGEGNIEIQAGVESVNGQTGALKLKTIDNKDVLGEGNMDILSDYSICMFMMYNLTLSEADKGVDLYKYGIGEDAANLDKYFSGLKTIQFLHFNIKDGASYKVPLTIFWDGNGNRQFRFVCEGYEYTYTSIDANYCDFTSKVKIGGGGDQNVIVLDGLTQEERKAVYDKLDKTKAPDEVFVYEGKTSVRAYWGGGNYLKFITFNDNYDGLKVEMYSLNPDGNLGLEERGMTYTNSVLMHLGNHVDESGYFECMYIGNFFEYILRPYTRPNACFINLEKGIGDSTRPIYAPVSTLVERYGDRNNVRMQFFANEKLYTFLLDPNQDNKWIFESAKPITGGGSGESSKTYYFFNDPTRDPNAPNAHNVEVFRAFDKAVQDGGAFNNFYIVNGNETSGQTPYNPILQVTKMEAADNGVWGGNKGYYVFAGQKNNVETEKLQVHKYCLTDIGGVIDFMVNAIDGGTWTSGVHSKIDDVLTAGADIPCTFEYLEGCDETYFWADNMGGKQGLYNITFNGGYDGYKGNVVADVYGNATGVYMAFTVNNVRYTYKKNDTTNKWELTKSVQIGGVQSTEVSNIKVLTQSEYDALNPKDPNTMYCIKG